MVNKIRKYTDAQMKAEILYEAYQLFSLYGIKRVRMIELASQMGMSRTTLYKYYSSKRELVKEMLERLRERAIYMLEEVADDRLSFEEKLQILRKDKISMIQEIGETYLNELMKDDEYRQILEKMQKEISGLMLRFLKHEQKLGNIRRDFPAEFLSIFFLKMQKIFEDEQLTGFFPSLADFTDAMIEIIFKGVAKR